MKTIIVALLCSVALPAWAGSFDTGDSYGPRGKGTETDGRPYARPTPARAAAAPSWSSAPWTPGSGYAPGYVDPSPEDMKRFIDENYAHARRTYDAVVDAGGCNAPLVPFEIASYCGSQAFGGSQNNNQFGSSGQ
jgi:hypothetical protein